MNKRQQSIVIVFLSMILTSSAVAGSRPAGHEHPQYQAIRKKLLQGWNTWDSRSVLRHVLLPEGFAVNLAFKQHAWLEEKYLAEALIGRRGEGVEEIRPGAHAYDGSYTSLEINWQQLSARVESAVEGDDLVIRITPLVIPASPVKVIVETGMLWNRPGLLKKGDDYLSACLPGRSVDIYMSASHVVDPYVKTLTPYLAAYLKEAVGISTGRRRTVQEIGRILDREKERLEQAAGNYGELAEAHVAMQAGIAWNTIYEPRHNRVVSTVGRLWNEEYGGYCLFGWDNFFLAYVTALDSRDLAYANVIEHLRGKTEEGFIPNDNRGNGSKSWDRSQPPVGSIMVREIYKRYPRRWFLEATFDDLLGWNRWWIKKRLNNGLLSYGSHRAKNPFQEPAVQSKRTAGYESGMDDSPMYTGVPFNPHKNTLELQDVGLNSLYIADCLALADMARVLGRKEEDRELRRRAGTFRRHIQALWHEPTGLYLNRRTDSGRFSMRFSPSLFYPLLGRIPSRKRARRIMQEHFYNPREFYGPWMLPSVSRSDPDFPRQRYWKGAIWPPLNFLVYLGLRQYGMEEARRELAEKSLNIFLGEWRRRGYVSENYSAINGSSDDPRLSSDKFHSWGSLLAMISFIEKGIMPPPETEISPN